MPRSTSPFCSLPQAALSLALLATALPLRSASGVSGQVATQPSASQSNAPSTASRPHLGSDSAAPPDPFAGHNAVKMEHMREDERRKRLQADMAKLVELTNELKTAVDNTSKDELSIDVVRRAAEIEKLAHDVKERMKS